MFQSITVQKHVSHRIFFAVHKIYLCINLSVFKNTVVRDGVRIKKIKNYKKNTRHENSKTVGLYIFNLW